MTLLWFVQSAQYGQLLDHWVISRFFAVVKNVEVNNLVSKLCTQLLSCIWLFAAPWTVVCQVALHYFCLFCLHLRISLDKMQELAFLVQMQSICTYTCIFNSGVERYQCSMGWNFDQWEKKPVGKVFSLLSQHGLIWEAAV